jgi:SAM-dependent methyltransferase
MASEKRSAKFNSKLYEVESVEHARALILTAEQGTTTDERWEKETDFLASEIGETLALKETDIVLDYGCGIGRVSKVLIEQYGCRVVGVDASKSMRLMAPDYVLSNGLLSGLLRPYYRWLRRDSEPAKLLLFGCCNMC